MSKLEGLLKRQNSLLGEINHIRKMLSQPLERFSVNASGYHYYSAQVQAAAVESLKLDLEAKVVEADAIAEKLSLIDKLIS